MRIAVLGGYGVGLSMHLPRAPRAGETVSNGRLSTGHGGKGSNQAVAAARLGATVSLLSAVGQDASGQEAFSLWEKEGVEAEHVVQVPGEATMTGFIIVDHSGENRIIIAPGALASLRPEHVEVFAPTILSSDALVVSLEIPVPAAVRAMEIARKAGVYAVLNPAPAENLPRDLWFGADLLTPNLSEARALCEADSSVAPDELAQQLRAVTGGDVVVTLGAAGSVVASDDGVTCVPPVVPGRVVDTTGAGDSFTAALTVARLEGMSLAEAAGYAAQAGAFTVATPEVVPALPYRADLTGR